MGKPSVRTHTSSNSPGAGRRFPGLYLGTVTNNNDPRGLNRVKVRVTEVGGQLELAWARVLVGFAGPEVGFSFLPEVGTRVVVAFEAEDANRPVVVGLGYDESEGASQIPRAAAGNDDPVREGRGQDSATGAGGIDISEPADPYGPEYPNNKVFKTSSGHLIEYDDTEGAERISITHGTSQSYLEFHPDGSVVLGCKKKLYTWAEEDAQEHYKGAHDVKVDGDSTFSTEAHRMSCEKLTLKAVKTALFEALGEIKFDSKKQVVAKAPLVQLGPQSSPGNVVTNVTHPVDYITGIPIQGTPSVQAG